ncbi:hypothetical protein MAPG_03307 [Magnaporthiopsis poae ATCC 64411]|uniref:Uncharacterized protein n=1 Tax=Magnaporthiopsis poae (strain ATCC 64411 / 73-15) TaxID=644358 RepID=A0A0C4DTN6_MAGP6|nr:hypothetical protein MAPG_03307 [Magnaporthiopsis poae ATCC 64411]
MCSSWECMNQATQFGIVFSVIFTALTIIFLYWYLVLKQRQPPDGSGDVEVVEIELPCPGRAEEGARLQWRNYEGQDTATRAPANIFFFTQPQIIRPPKPRRQIEYRQAHEDEPEDRQAHSEEDTLGQESPPPSRRRKPKKPNNPSPQPPTKTLPPFTYHAGFPEYNPASPSASAQSHEQRPVWANYHWQSPPWTWQQQQQLQPQQQAQPGHASQPYHHTGSYQPSQPQMMYWYQVAQRPANPHAPRAMPVSVQVPQVPQAFPQSLQQTVQSTHPGQFARLAQFTQTVQFTQPVQPTSIPQHTQPTQPAQQGTTRKSEATLSQQDFMGQPASSIHPPTALPAMSRTMRTNSIHTDQHGDEPVTRGASWWRRLIWRLPVTGRASTVDGSSTSRSLSTEASPSRSPSPAPRRSKRRFRSQETRHRDRRRPQDSPAADERISGSLSSRSRSPSRVRARGRVANGSRKHPRRYSESLGGDIPEPQSDHPDDRPSRRSSTPDFPDLSSLPSHTTLDSAEPPSSPSTKHGKNHSTRDRPYPERSGSIATDWRPQSHTQVTEPPEPTETPQISMTPSQAAVARDSIGRRPPAGIDRRVSFDEDPVSQSHTIEEISETTESAPGISEQREPPDNAQRVKLHPRIPAVEPRVLYVEASPSEQGRAGLASEPTKSEAGSSTVVVAKVDAGNGLAGADPEPGNDSIPRSTNQAQHRDRHVRDRRQTSSHRTSVGRRRRSDAASSDSGESYMPSPPKPFATQTFSGRTSITGRKFGRDSKLSVADSMEVQLSPDETVFPGQKIPPAKQRRGSEARGSSSTTFYRFRGSED